MVRWNGSHAIFHKPGEGAIPFPVRRGKVTRVYIALIFDKLGIE
jgi:hypothetical protein